MAKTATITATIKYVGNGEDRNVVFTNTNTAAPPGESFAGVTGQNGPYGTGHSSDTFLGALYLPPVSSSGIPSVSQVPKQLIQGLPDVGIPLDPAAPQVLAEPFFSIFLTAPETITIKPF